MNLKLAFLIAASVSVSVFAHVTHAQSVCSDVFVSSEVLALEASPVLEARLNLIANNLRVDAPINAPAEIPFENSSSFRPVSNAEMLKRAPLLEPEIADAITKTYNALNDKAMLNEYFQQLFVEASQWLRKHGRPEDLKLVEERRISFQALAVVLIKRAKARGETGFTTILRNKPLSNGRLKLDPASIEKANDGFRAAIRSGPFFDRNFTDDPREGHGRITHLLQRDIVTQALEAQTPGLANQLFTYLGSKKGVNWWADLFDSGNTKSFTRPETLNAYITHSLID